MLVCVLWFYCLLWVWRTYIPFTILTTSIWFPLSLLVSTVFKPHYNKRLSYLRSLNLDALRCILSNLSMSFLRYGLHAWIQYCKCVLTIALYRDTISCFSFYMIVILINHIIWFPFEAAIPHCSETFMPALNVTPKSFSCVVLPRTASPILYSSSMVPCPMCIHLHFPKLNNICHFSDHLTNLARSSCKLCLSVSLVTFLNTYVSSANFSALLDMSFFKSFKYIKNSIGPNTDPCGTPLKTYFQFEISPSTITLCLLCVSHFSIQLITSLPIPWTFSLNNYLWCGTLSKASWKSK